MPASVGFIVIDSVNPDELARFWCGLLDVQVESNIGEGQFIVLSATAEGLVVGFQQVPEAKSGKTGCTLTWWSSIWTPRPPRSRAWAGDGWSPAAHANWRASGAGAWPTRKATSSTSTRSRPADSAAGHPADTRPPRSPAPPGCSPTPLPATSPASSSPLAAAGPPAEPRDHRRNLPSPACGYAEAGGPRFPARPCPGT